MLDLANLLYEAGKIAGTMSFIGLSLLIISGDTARFFDKYFGLDRIIKFQRKFATLMTVVIFSHPILFTLSSGVNIDRIIPNFSNLSLAMGVVSFYMFLVIIIASKLYKRIPHTAWQYLHIFTYVLFFFVLYHAINQSGEIEFLHIALLVGIIIGIIFRTQYKIKAILNDKFIIKYLEKKTHNTYTITVTPNKKFNFKAGQFCFLRLEKNKLYARHPFTISSSPDKSDINFTIKHQGKFTKETHDLKIGEEIKVDGPFGKFIIKNKTKNLVFIAGGVGITPFMSMINDQIYNNEKQNITLLYGCKNENEIIFKKELDRINEDWFKKIYILSQENKINKNRESGYIDKSIIEKYVNNTNDSIFYICGPETMKNSITKILKDMGVAKKNIIIEDFFW